MKSASLLGCLFVSLCLLSNVESDFGDFLNNLPREIGNAFTSAWGTIIEAIKKPVRVKRLGPGGRRKACTSTSTSRITLTEPPETVKPFSFYPSIKGLQVPVLPIPRWHTIDEWKTLQIPRFAKVIRNKKYSSTIVENEIIDRIDVAPTVTGPAKLDDEENFGVLFFI